ncbi:MAG TPA: PKD domain-containing protein, partial [Candidatus Angelobacter sp.]
VYVSQDGENLMWLADEPTGTSSLDLKSFQLNAGNYSVFVQAVGKPSLTNKMSAGAAVVIQNQPPVAMLALSPSSGKAPLAVTASSTGSYDPDGNIASTVINFGDGSASVSSTIANHTYSASGNYVVTVTVTDNLGASTNKTANVSVTGSQPFAFTSSDTSATVMAGQTASYNLTLDTKGSGFTGAVSVVCDGAPAGTTCTANPASANFSASNASVPVTITVATTTQARFNPVPREGLPFFFATVLAGLFCGATKRARQMLLAMLAILLLLSMISCGGGASTSTTPAAAPRSPTNATLTVMGASGNQTATATLSLTITH